MINLIMRGLEAEIINKKGDLELAKKHIDRRLENIGMIVGRLSRMTNIERDKVITDELENIKMITFEINRIKKMHGFLRRRELGDYITNKTIEVLRHEAMKLGRIEKKRMSVVLEKVEKM